MKGKTGDDRRIHTLKSYLDVFWLTLSVQLESTPAPASTARPAGFSAVGSPSSTPKAAMVETVESDAGGVQGERSAR